MGTRFGRRPHVGVRGLIAAALIAALSLEASAQGMPPALAFRSEGPVSVEAVDRALTALAARRADLPADAPEGSPAALMKTVVDRRTNLLTELRDVLEERSARAALVHDLPALDEKLRAERESLANEKTAVAPASPTTEGAAALRDQLVEARKTAEKLRSEIGEATSLAADAGTLKASLQQRKDHALAEADEAEHDLTSGVDVRELEARRLAVENARLDARIADAKLELLDVEQKSAAAVAEHRALAAEVADQRVERLEVELEMYRTALAAALTAEQRQKRAALDAKEAAARKASSPAERIIATWEARIARAENLLPELEAFEVKIGKVIEDQDHQLAEDKALLERLREYVEKYGTDGYTGEMIRNAFRSLAAKRLSVREAVPATISEPLSKYRAHTVEVDQTLLDLNAEWESDYEAAAPTLSPYEQAALRAKRFPLRDGLRRVTSAEKAALDRIAALGRRLHAVVAEREQVIDDLDVFIRARVLWIRDRAMIDGTTLARGYADLVDVSRRAAHTIATETRALAGSIAQSPVRLVYVLLMILISAAIVRGARVQARRRRERPPAQRQSVLTAIGDLAVASHATPAVLVVLAIGLGFVDATETVALLPATLLYLAAFTLLRALTRELFADGGIADHFAWLDRDARALIKHAITAVLWGALVCLLPWTLLRGTGLAHQALPRLTWTVFLLIVSLVLWRLCRPDSPVVAAFVDTRTLSRRTIARSAWRVLLPVFLLAVPALDVAGYSFTASRLVLAQLSSLAVLVVLLPGYRWALRIARRSTRTQPTAPPQATTGATTAGLPHTAGNGRRRAALVRALFLVAGIVLLARIWGIDEQGWRTLQSVKLYQVAPAPDGTAQFVTLASVITAVLVMLVTVWLLRHLPGIYDLALFPRMQVDTGLRYAIVTISRYGLFFIGLLIAIRAVRFDMTSIGWLVAAMGVGLGFGLQEIVSNFVSGLILLVERPIRVDDIVTVGQLTGRVQRINIRATTVINFDRQEVIVPNRELITQDVINWTLADPVNRLIVKIGVEYGSDPEAVRACLRDVATSDPQVLKDPEPQVLFVNHGESSLDFELRVFLAEPAHRPVVMDRLNTRINRALAEKGIGIPFPQRDLHVKSWAPEVGPTKS